jgi:hypothetical protein
LYGWPFSFIFVLVSVSGISNSSEPSHSFQSVELYTYVQECIFDVPITKRAILLVRHSKVERSNKAIAGSSYANPKAGHTTGLNSSDVGSSR